MPKVDDAVTTVIFGHCLMMCVACWHAGCAAQTRRLCSAKHPGCTNQSRLRHSQTPPKHKTLTMLTRESWRGGCRDERGRAGSRGALRWCAPSLHGMLCQRACRPCMVFTGMSGWRVRDRLHEPVCLCLFGLTNFVMSVCSVSPIS